MIGNKSKLLIFFSALSSSVNCFSETSANQQSINVVNELQKCRKVITKLERLSCYEKLAIRFSPPRYKGRLGMITDPFTIKKPHRIRYRSYGVIFVLYLRDKDGNVLQNLHLGGTGEDSYLIETPGKYSLKIQGSDSWEIWLEPEIDVAATEK